jgi:hypothetical protein
MSEADAQLSPTATSFTVEGTRNGSPVIVRWRDGVLSGDPPTVDLVEMEAELVVLGRSDPFALRTGAAEAGRSSAGLAEPQTALELITAVMDRITSVAEDP